MCQKILVVLEAYAVSARGCSAFTSPPPAGLQHAGAESAIMARREAILRQLGRRPDLEGTFALKGGAALNLFFLDVARLSVDIDINCVGDRSI